MRPYNVATWRRAAKRRLPRHVFDYLDGGAEDEVTLRANSSGFGRISLNARVPMTDDAVRLGARIAGQEMTMPVILAPIGNMGMVHHSGDLAAAKVAADLGLIMVMSANSSYGIEEVGSALEHKPWYQIYPWIDRSFYGGLIDRAAAAGYRGLVFTVDSAVLGNRERDVANSFQPSGAPLLTIRSASEALRHPRWTWDVVRHRRVVISAFRRSAGKPSLASLAIEAKRAAAQVSRTMLVPTWDELEWIRSRWSGPLAIKGIMHADDAKRAISIGCDVVFVSNHGGRQLDGVAGAIDALPAIAEAVGSDAEVVLDGGIRRGSDIVKAMCLGARAVSVGRPWVYGLASQGQEGAEQVLEGLRNELRTTMRLLGAPDVARLDSSWLTPVTCACGSVTAGAAGGPKGSSTRD